MSWNPLQSLSDDQRARLAAFEKELLYLNARHNLVSRQSVSTFFQRHIVHCLALSRKRFLPASAVVDWGTGGGLPAIPLAIAFPEIEFYPVDSAQKKIHAVRTLVRRLGLHNLHPWHGRAEMWPGQAHYSVSRATASLLTLWQWHLKARLQTPHTSDGSTWAPGVLSLKGGNLTLEMAELTSTFPTVQARITRLDTLLGTAFFDGKVLVELFQGDGRNGNRDLGGIR